MFKWQMGSLKRDHHTTFSKTDFLSLLALCLQERYLQYQQSYKIKKCNCLLIHIPCIIQNNYFHQLWLIYINRIVMKNNLFKPTITASVNSYWFILVGLDWFIVCCPVPWWITILHTNHLNLMYSKIFGQNINNSLCVTIVHPYYLSLMHDTISDNTLITMTLGSTL